MSDKRVIVIGIDGLDRGLVEQYRDVMPNLHALMRRGTVIPMESVNPPDSNTAWASIYTGLNPAQHGFVQFMDPLARVQLISTQEVAAGVFQGRTFWDAASAAGRRVCLLLPHLAYPVWPVNGVMIGRSTVEDRVECYPASAEPRARLDRLNTIKGFPGSRRGYPAYLKRVSALIDEEGVLGADYLRAGDWDLFFWYSSALDLIMHFFWHYADTTDPAYPGPNEYEGIIRDFHARYDRILGQMLAEAPAKVPVVLLSDHGHGMRPVRLLNINELLRREGLFVKQSSGARRSAALGLLERAKRVAVDLVGRYNLGPFASKVLKHVPAARRVFTNPLTVDWDKTVAYTTDLSGIKSYSYGGIIVRREGLTAEGYEAIRERAIRVVREARDPDTGRSMVRMIARREDLYQGEHIEKYPDVVFDLEYGYGAGWAAGGELMSTSPGHSLVPGSHKADSAVLVIAVAKDQFICVDRPAELADVAPTIFALLGLDTDLSGCAGSSLLRPSSKTSHHY